jgi:hypothetical protein
MAGRPRREGEIEVVFLRLPIDVVERVAQCKGMIETRERKSFSRTEAFCRILEAGCEALERTLEGRVPAAPAQRSIAARAERAPIAQRATVANGTPPVYDDMLAFLGDEGEAEPLVLPVDVPPAAETPIAKTPARHALPREKLLAIAEERRRATGLSLKQFAQHLHEREIYSSMGKDGSRKPADPSTLRRWLKQARKAGLL